MRALPQDLAEIPDSLVMTHARDDARVTRYICAMARGDRKPRLGPILATLRARLPELIGVYRFSSFDALSEPEFTHGFLPRSPI